MTGRSGATVVDEQLGILGTEVSEKNLILHTPSLARLLIGR